ncbi:glycosyltransferase family 2 protein [Desulfovibrio sp. TomC]|uniref:glycosyltransferase family 2 protein n=1 Tax=Desulfovibrio sp. TomC TaxID=1562888 RepID=UPI00057347CA|nr:glycosyltransferase family 2 protein [Desulfovibrio sp. TomC]KHK02807.1 Hyaluronan synthase [Desulfovibrio sp. TomC]
MYVKEKSNRQLTQVDLSYITVLAFTFLIGGAAVFSILSEQEYVMGIIEDDILILYENMSLGLAPLTALLLSWRLVMAWKYRAVPPVDNATLPMVTIIIPAYNEGRQVLLTLRSVMASNYPPAKMHVLCIDDGSQDDTWTWMRLAATEFPTRIQLIRQPSNTGKRHALLAGFAQARGSVFVTLDSDSEILPDTLRHLVSPIATDPKVGAVAGNVRVLNVGHGLIPKMLDLSFTMSFDFQRRGQSVYGGVLCTPGALSAYRISAVAPSLPAWAEQTFLGRAANIGEDRALSNIVLRQGYRVVYQNEAVVLTEVPVAYQGLCRMMLRWARSNVRECLVMAQFIGRRFRKHDSGMHWLRLAGTMELLFLPLTEAMKAGLLITLLLHPTTTLMLLAASCALSAILPALVYNHLRRAGLRSPFLAVSYALFWVFCLSWISCWGLLSAGCSGWLTRKLAGAPSHEPSLGVLHHPKEA